MEVLTIYPLRVAAPPPNPKGEKSTTSAGRPRGVLALTLAAAKPGQAFDLPDGLYSTDNSAYAAVYKTAQREGREVQCRRDLDTGIRTVYVVA